MSQLEVIAGQLRALARGAGPISDNVDAAADQLRNIASRLESLRHSGADVRAVEGAVLSAEAHAQQAADAVRQVKSEGVAWADQLASGGKGGTGVGATASSSLGGTSSAELSTADIEALRDYTASGYYDLNGITKGLVPWNSDIERRSSAVSAALQKLPPHRGQVLRGANLRDVSGTGSWSFWGEPGSMVTVPEFFSSDIDTPFKGDTSFTIQSKNGKSVQPYSSHKRENEVIFDRNTSFRVLQHIVDPQTGVHHIHLEEL